MVKEKEHLEEKTREVIEGEKNLILFNDDYNTFDFVIESLVEVCGHAIEQAEQCALITHFKGKCAVKNGSLDSLKPLKDEMINRALTVEIH